MKKRRKYTGPKPVKVGEEYLVEIREISKRGDGIARIEGFVIFVPNTKIGDRVKIIIKRVAARYAVGEIIE